MIKLLQKFWFKFIMTHLNRKFVFRLIFVNCYLAVKIINKIYNLYIKKRSNEILSFKKNHKKIIFMIRMVYVSVVICQMELMM